MNELRKVILTGASSGLGRAAALEFLHAGYEVALIGRNEQKLEDVLDGLPLPERRRAHAVVADLSEPKQVEKLYQKCHAILKSSPDIFVYCAGMAITGRIEDVPADALERCWRVNFSSAVSLTQQMLPDLKARKGGMIVNVTSGVARRALPFISPYCSAKAALHSFTESLRLEVKDFGIKIAFFFPVRLNRISMRQPSIMETRN